MSLIYCGAYDRRRQSNTTLTVQPVTDMHALYLVGKLGRRQRRGGSTPETGVCSTPPYSSRVAAAVLYTATIAREIKKPLFISNKKHSRSVPFRPQLVAQKISIYFF